MNTVNYPQDTSVNPQASPILGAWQNLQIILGQQILRYIQSVNTKNSDNGCGVSISDISGLLTFLENTINNSFSVFLKQTISISKLKTNNILESKKQIVKFNESQPHRIIKESVKNVIKEKHNDFPTAEFYDPEYTIDDELPYNTKIMVHLRGSFYAFQFYPNRGESPRDSLEQKGCL